MRWRTDGEEGRIPLSKAIAWITLSVIAVSGTLSFSWFYYMNYLETRRTDPSYQLKHIVLDGNVDVDPALMAKILGVKHNQSLYRFPVSHLNDRLLRFPLFKAGTVEKIPPSTLYVKYELKAPLYYLGDFSNGAIDAEGTVFPPSPFYAPKNLPTLYFGNMEGNPWGKKVDAGQFELARMLREALQEPFHQIKVLDLTRVEAPSYGVREILVLLEETVENGDRVVIYPRLLRLSVDGFEMALEHYKKLRPLLSQGEGNSLKVIDLRIKSLAFIGGVTND